jgi:GDP/UDP-N,N'-diacetylbacillosamine 2-epimerase (hydrolysing)
MKRKLCIVTGSRAEYGLLKWLMRDIQADPEFTLQVVATGMHLSPEFGLTWQAIEQDGFRIDWKVEMLLSSDTASAVTKSMGIGLIGYAEAFQNLSPDMIIVLGDRFEILAAATAATVARIPIAHLHGGERTEGAIDESFRHAITKMGHFHFTATEEYRQRVIQMGESPERVHNTGALGIDGILKTPRMDRKTLEQELGFTLLGQNLLITFHPVTLESQTSESQFKALLEALDTFTDTGLIFTKANADTNGRIINFLIDAFVATRPDRAVAHTSLGQLRYLSTLAVVDAVVGNSSSGIIEAPSFGIGSVNIGDRQKGRIRAGSIIDCPPEKEAIKTAIEQALSPAFRESLPSASNPFGKGDASERIMKALKTPWSKEILFKRFHDLSGRDQV